MVQAEGTRPPAHPEEWLSIVLALCGPLGCIAFFWMAPQFQPNSASAWAIPGWMATAYVLVQIFLLLVSATQIRTLGVLDTIVAILPVVGGLVTFIEWGAGHLPLSHFQLNALALLVATTLGEFLLTVWIRFVLNRRTIAVDAG
jgi:hypothetical protein